MGIFDKFKKKSQPENQDNNTGNFVKMGKFFEAEVNGIKISISDTIMSDETLKFTEKVLSVYPQKIMAIAEFISQDECIADRYNLSKEEIASKLHKPDVLIADNGGLLSYCENEIDCNHVIDVEFGGVLEEFYEVIING